MYNFQQSLIYPYIIKFENVECKNYAWKIKIQS